MINYLKKLWRKYKAAILPVKKYPHEIFPELLEWQKGDKLQYVGNTFDACFEFSTRPYFIKFDEDSVYLEDYLRSKKTSFPVKWVMKHYYNVSLETRRTELELKNVSEYEVLVEDFKNAVKDLKIRTIV